MLDQIWNSVQIIGCKNARPEKKLLSAESGILGECKFFSDGRARAESTEKVISLKSRVISPLFLKT